MIISREDGGMSRKGKTRRIGTPRSLTGGIRRMEAAASHGGKWAWAYQSFSRFLEDYASEKPDVAAPGNRLRNREWLVLIYGWLTTPHRADHRGCRAVLAVELLLRVLRIGRTN